jgi:hypothetical protein
MSNKYSIGQAKLGDLVQSDRNGYRVICLVVGLPDKVNNFQYVKLKVMNETGSRFFPSQGTTFHQSPHNRLWTPLTSET